jgi:hypothetical protein
VEADGGSGCVIERHVLRLAGHRTLVIRCTTESRWPASCVCKCKDKVGLLGVRGVGPTHAIYPAAKATRETYQPSRWPMLRRRSAQAVTGHWEIDVTPLAILGGEYVYACSSQRISGPNTASARCTNSQCGTSLVNSKKEGRLKGWRTNPIINASQMSALNRDTAQLAHPPLPPPK